MNNRLRNPRKLVHKGSYQKNSKAHDNDRLSKSRVCFAIRTTVPVPVLLQRSLMHSNSARFSQTIIHSALFKGLKEKRPDPSRVFSSIYNEKQLKIATYSDCQKNVPFAEGFFATTAYTAILFRIDSERIYDKRYNFHARFSN